MAKIWTPPTVGEVYDQRTGDRWSDTYKNYDPFKLRNTSERVNAIKKAKNPFQGTGLRWGRTPTLGATMQNYGQQRNPYVWESGHQWSFQPVNWWRY